MKSNRDLSNYERTPSFSLTLLLIELKIRLLTYVLSDPLKPHLRTEHCLRADVHRDERYCGWIA